MIPETGTYSELKQVLFTVLPSVPKTGDWFTGVPLSSLRCARYRCQVQCLVLDVEEKVIVHWYDRDGRIVESSTVPRWMFMQWLYEGQLEPFCEGLNDPRKGQ